MRDVSNGLGEFADTETYNKLYLDEELLVYKTVRTTVKLGNEQ